MDSSSAMKKKASKPAIEKRRRARINDSVTQLAEMVMSTDILNQNRPVRLQKSHILEKAVDYIRNMKQRERKSAEKQFQDGYRHCMSEIQNFFSREANEAMSENLQRFLVRRLGRLLQEQWTSRHTQNHRSHIDDHLNTPFPLFCQDVRANENPSFSIEGSLRSSSCSDSNGSSDSSGVASEDESMEEVQNCDSGSPLWRPW